jgi:hypothetical protein
MTSITARGIANHNQSPLREAGSISRPKSAAAYQTTIVLNPPPAINTMALVRNAQTPAPNPA